MTDPTVGACVWASGSQVWNGNIGTLIPKPMKRPAKIHTCVLLIIPTPATSVRTLMSKVCRSSPAESFDRKNRARKLMIINADPNNVYRKNFNEA